MTDGFIHKRLARISADGSRSATERAIAIEAPVAIEVNGLGYAVLMVTPTDLEDLVYGFLSSERLIDGGDDVVETEVHEVHEGTVLRVWLVEARKERVTERVRHRISESSCGLCGIENLEQALRPLPTVTNRSAADESAIFRALEALEDRQPLNMQTGAVHAAALCAPDGAIRIVREDVGRHNAFDKLLGTMLRRNISWDGGFALLSSRCSYELVEKAALANCPLLATISAPTSFALERAEKCGLPLIVLGRPDSYLAT